MCRKPNRIIARQYLQHFVRWMANCEKPIFTVTYKISSSVEREKNIFSSICVSFSIILGWWAFQRIHFIRIYLSLFTIAWASLVYGLWCFRLLWYGKWLTPFIRLKQETSILWAIYASRKIDYNKFQINYFVKCSQIVDSILCVFLTILNIAR